MKHLPDGDKQAYSIIEAARKASISRSLAYEEIRAGRLIASKIGRRTIITKTNFQAWLDNLEVSQ